MIRTKKPSHLSCRFLHNLNFANCLLVLAFAMFLCPLYFL